MSNFFISLNLTSIRLFEGFALEVRPKWPMYAPSPSVSSHLDAEPPPRFRQVPYGHRALENCKSTLIRA